VTEEMQWRFGDDVEKEPLLYTGCGLDDVYLLSGYDTVSTQHGTGIKVRNLEGLHQAIGHYLAAHKKLLSGKELRFLRNHMNLTQSELGKLVGLRSQQVARWEKEECSISGAAESLIRILYLDNLDDDFEVRELLNDLDALDDRVNNMALFAETMDGWRPLSTQAA